MSAIWGMIRRDGQPVDPKIVDAMGEFQKKYKIDHVDDMKSQAVYFACAHQYLVPGAKFEHLPYYDGWRRICFTADCILDNRQELLDELGLVSGSADSVMNYIPDGAIAYEAYLKWGEKFVDRLLGIFSIAIYDVEKDLFLLYTDHTGSRCVNYMVRQDAILFGTTYDLFKCALGSELKLSEKWIAGCVREPSACMIIFPGLTPYEDVYQVKAGHYVRIQAGKVSEIRYYHPMKVKPLRLGSEEEYRAHFIETLQKCMQDVLRPGVKVGATLSGGLDSSTVVSFAAPILAERGETLHTYTSVPDPEFGIENDGYDVADESPMVLKTAECFSNLEPHFVSCAGEGPIEHLEDFVRAYGLPVKSAVNLLWIDAANRQAREAGCTILLSGQHGNTTISYGDIFSLAYQEVLKFRIWRAKSEVATFLTRNRIPKANFKRVLKNNLAEKCASMLNREQEAELQHFAKKDCVKKYGIDKQRHRDVRKHGIGSLNSNKQKRRLPHQLAELQQMGIYNTMTSLLNGVVERDITKDRRVIDLCISYPMNCFVSKGLERNMVRGYLEGIVPEHIRLDIRHRGNQGADRWKRINRSWKSVQDDVIQKLSNPRLSEYMESVELQRLRDLCEGMDEFLPENGSWAIYMMQFYALSCFLEG